MADTETRKLAKVSAFAAYQQMKEQQKQQQQPTPVILSVAQNYFTKQDDRQKKRKNNHKSNSPATNSSAKKAKLNVDSSSGKQNHVGREDSSLSTASKVAVGGVAGPKSKRKKKKQQKHGKQQPQMQQQLQQGLGLKISAKTPTDYDEIRSGNCSSETGTEDDSVIDPMVEATEVFKEIIAPVGVDQFFSIYWEKKPLLVKRNTPGHYDDWFSTADFDELLRKHRVMFGEHLDVTSYRDGKRETHNPEGRALASQAWQFYESGCSLRLLCPQVFHERVYQKLSILHEQFGAFVGANVYLTPPGTQGFAPHWDDIEAFVMQLEGRKHWRVYAPRSPAERLPRESSGNFGPRDRLGQPIIDAVLEPGDLLYMPRGFIHQGRCLEGFHSLHITVSTYQKFAWADLLSEALSGALERAAREDVEFRRGLPLGLLGFAGCVFRNVRGEANRQRREAEELCRSLLARLSAHVSLDEAADKLACGQVRDALPPALDPSESACSAYGAGLSWDARRLRPTAGGSPSVVKLTSRVRLVRRSAARLTANGRLHTSLDNTRVFRETEPSYLEVEPSLAPGVAALSAAYPDFLTVGDLPIADPADRVALASGLYDRGLLLMQESDQ